jgi:RNA polymerase sigma-70 factor (ECF subfamily)
MLSQREESERAGRASEAVRSSKLPTRTGTGRDEGSADWPARLASRGPDRDAAVQELHALLIAAARVEVNRRRATLPHWRGDDHDDIAQQSADDALVAVLRKLPEFRGDSQFTTWAYKFALFEAAAKVRKRAWQAREVPLEPTVWPLLADSATGPGRTAESNELLQHLQTAIAHDLSPHQREVLVALTLNGVPIDVLAERLNTTRGALYKTLHDARRKLRTGLAAAGLDPGTA